MKRGRQPAGAGEGKGDGGRRITRQRQGAAAAADGPPVEAMAGGDPSANKTVPTLAGPVISAAAAGAIAMSAPDFTAAGFAMLLGELREMRAAWIAEGEARLQLETAFREQQHLLAEKVVMDDQLRWALGNAGPGMARGLNAATRPWPEHVLVTHPHAHEGAILGKIIEMLDADGLKAAGQVCRAWDQAAQFYRVTRSADGTVREPACGVFDAIVAPGQSVQAAVDGVRSGGCVLLLPGTHQGPLVLTKDVHLFGRGLAQLEGANADVFLSDTPTATVDGLTIRCLANAPVAVAAPAGQPEYNAVHVRSGGVRFQSCEFSSASGGAVDVVGQLSFPHFVRCRFRNSNKNGLQFQNNASGRVDRCDFDGYNCVSVLILSANPVVSNCTFNGVGETIGIGVQGAASTGRIENCNVVGGKYGIVIMEAADPLVVGCTFNGGGGTVGIFVHGATSTGRIENCTVVGGDNGIVITAAADPLVVGCTFRGTSMCGAVVINNGKGRFRTCMFVDGQNDGLLVTKSGDPVLETGCVFKNNLWYGIVIRNTALGKAMIDVSTVFEGNGEGEVYREEAAEPRANDATAGAGRLA